MRLTGRDDKPFTHVIANLEMIFLLLFLNLLFACVLHFGVSNIKNHYKVTAFLVLATGRSCCGNMVFHIFITSHAGHPEYPQMPCFQHIKAICSVLV